MYVIHVQLHVKQSEEVKVEWLTYRRHIASGFWIKARLGHFKSVTKNEKEKVTQPSAGS